VRTREPADSLRTLCEAYAVRMPPGQYFSHLTAAQLWGFPLPRRLEAASPLHVSVGAPSREPRMRVVVGHRGTAGAGIRLLGTLPVLAPADTWFQLARFLEPDDLIAAGDRLFRWRDHLVTRDELAEAGERMRQQAGGIRKARLALREIRENSNSPRETKLRLEVLRAGFPEPELNGEIALGNGRRTWGDLVFQRWGTLMEFDGKRSPLSAVERMPLPAASARAKPRKVATTWPRGGEGAWKLVLPARQRDDRNRDHACGDGPGGRHRRLELAGLLSAHPTDALRHVDLVLELRECGDQFGPCALNLGLAVQAAPLGGAARVVSGHSLRLPSRRRRRS